MKWFIVPDDVQHVHEITGEIFEIDGRKTTSFFTFMMSAPLMDPKHFGTGLAALDARAEIVEAFKQHRPDGPDGPARLIRAGDKVGIPEEGYKILLAAINKPTNEFHPLAANFMRRFMHAIRDAKDSPEALTPAEPKLASVPA